MNLKHDRFKAFFFGVAVGKVRRPYVEKETILATDISGLRTLRSKIACVDITSGVGNGGMLPSLEGLSISDTSEVEGFFVTEATMSLANDARLTQ